MDQVVAVECFYCEIPLHARQLRRPRGRATSGGRYTIGSSRTADAPAPVDHLLVELMGDATLVHTCEGMTGEVRQGSEKLSLAAWIDDRGSTFALPADAHVWLRLGAMSFVISTIEAPPPVGPPPLVFRWSEQKYLVGTGLGLALTLLAAWFIPPDARALSLDRFGPDVRFLQARIVPPEPPTPPPGRQGSAGGAAGKAAAAPGAAGAPRVRRRADRLASAAAARSPVRSAADVRREVQMLAWLGRWQPEAGTPLAEILADGSVMGSGPGVVLDTLMPNGVGIADRAGGLRGSGTGAGGTGVGEGTIGNGGIDRLDPGYGRGGCLTGAGKGCLGRRRAAVPQVIGGETIVRGSLDKEIIRRVVRRHLHEVRFCYEQELPRAPELSGRVAVNFTIGATGQVAAAVVQSSTLGNARAESCVVGAVRRWEFPQPMGGGIVIATYPFNFVVAGGR